jgi:riboflavin biosynthesis pyrimidine reductase
MKPVVICHMMSSIDGGLHPSRYTASPDGARGDWSAAYENIHDALDGDAWIVGRVTMAEMSKATAHVPVEHASVDRPVHVARNADTYAVALDRSGKLHFNADAIGGDHVVVLLGHDVSDSHLAELTADGVSYIVAEDADMNLAAMIDVLADRFGIRRLLLEGGGGINGSFFAAGLVDELSVLVAPALDGAEDVQGIITFPGGLSGRLRLSLIAAGVLEHGLVHLRYRTVPAN